jgi:anti-sigma28 factor (negative regulator of flagellin synthesis)
MYRPVSVAARRFVSRSKDGPGEELDRARSDAVKTSAGAGASKGMRLDLIARVRQEIADGTYDTPEKWEAALDRLLERLDLS